jgi:hypothetical protein
MIAGELFTFVVCSDGVAEIYNFLAPSVLAFSSDSPFSVVPADVQEFELQDNANRPVIHTDSDRIDWTGRVY